MGSLIDWSVARGRMMLVLATLFAAAGAIAYQALPKEGSPNIDVPVLYVSVAVPGASAEDVERLAVKPLEQELQDLDSLDRMTAYATQGHVGVVLEFDFDWDPAATVAEVRDRVDRAQAELPEDAEEPTVNEVNLSEFPIMVVSLSGDATERALLALAQDLQREIETLGAVLEADMVGHRDEQIDVIVDPRRLDALDVTPAALVAAVSANNRLVAAGDLETPSGSFAISVPGGFETLDEIYALPLLVDGDRLVTLGDVAEIRRAFVDRSGVARFNGETTVALQVRKRLGENILETAAAVRAVVEAERAGWPETLQAAVRVDVSLEEAPIVASMVGQLEGSVLTAVLLVMIVVLAALGLRSAFLVGLAVPGSFLLAFALMGALGLSVNNMVMFGMILAVGMLVDGAIVVAEFAERRLEEGAEPSAAYAEAAKRMFWPIVSSTATTLCAFLPMLLWPGLPGQFMRQLPLTLIFVLSASLIVALIFLPVVGAALGSAIARVGRLFGGGRRRPRAAAVSRARPTRRGGWVGALMRWIVFRPYGPLLALGAAGALIFGAVALFQTHDRGVEFFVETEPERAIVYVRARGNLSLEQADAMVREAETRLLGGVGSDGRTWERVDGLDTVFAFAGAGGLIQQGSEGPSDAVGQLYLELAPWESRLLRADPLRGAEVLAEVDARLADAVGFIAEVALQEEGPQQGKPIQVLVSGDRLEDMSAAADVVRAEMAAIDGVVDIDDTRPLPAIEWRLEIDRLAAGRLGADVASIGAMVQLATRGVTLDQTTPADSDVEIDVVARFPEADRSVAALDALNLRTAHGLAPLSLFVARAPAPEIGSIARRDGERFYLVRADVVDGATATTLRAELAERLETAAAEGRLGPVAWSLTGDAEEEAESQAFLFNAMLGALGLMFVILLAQFNSLYASLLVLSAVVMSVAGVLVGMVVMDQSFSIIMTGTGIVALAGIVVNNNIVLIDTYQEYAKRLPKLEAIASTVEDRLRPVLLTTITTIAGLTPMMFAASIDFTEQRISVGAPTALWWVQLATAVVFGLGFSTILTLMVTPSALALRAWLEIGVSRVVGRDGGRAARPADAPPPPRLEPLAAE